MSTERGVGKPWTPEEDRLLTQAVAIHGEVDNWKTVALSVPGRTNKACRKRWLHSLSPNVKKTAWTAEEDQKLLSLYTLHGSKWAVIARNISGRTDDACSKRYREALDPSLKRDEWTSEEDGKLLDAYARLGGRWGHIGQELNRSGLACRNRWRMMERKKSAGTRHAAANSASSDAPTVAAPLQEAQEPQPQPFQWQPEMDQSFWDTPLAPPPSAPTEFPTTPVVHGNEPTEHFCTCPFHSQPSGGQLFCGMPFPHDQLALPLLQQDGSVNGSQQQASCNYDAPLPSEFNAAFNMPMPSDPQRSSLPDDQSNAFYDMSFAADTSEGSGVMASADPVPLNADTYAQISSDDDPGHGDGMAIDAPSNSTSQHTGQVESAGASPSPPRTPDQETEDQQSTDGPRPARSYYRTPAEKAKSVPTRTRHIVRDGLPPRLSSTLPATNDPSVLAYACGHPSCWPNDATSSIACYATSKELNDHHKAEHAEDLGGSTPFRCGLPGCKKSWKSINGLQYHLQVSKAHFQQALAVIQPAGPTAGGTSTPVNDSHSDESQPKPRKIYPCPHPGCRNQYKQLSGLRYHLARGHPTELPVQLDIVPPSLARKVAEKQRRRDSSAAVDTCTA